MEFEGKKSVITPEGVFIIGTYDENGVPNAMNAAWGMQSDMGEITLMLGKHKTTDNFEKTGAFTVAFGTADTVLISDYFGVETGGRVNKIEKAGCHVHRSAHVNAPVIEEYPLTLECTVKSWDAETGYLIGEIVASQADESILTDGRVDLGKLKPIIFDPSFHVYRVVGEAVGNAFRDGLKLKQDGIYDFTIPAGTGEALKLSDYRGRVIMVVNTATGCGFTPQYEPIEKMYRDYHDQGLEILDIPCNQFGGQAPGTDEEIHEFCTVHYNTTFPQMKKADVNGERELPLYTYLKAQKGFAGFDEHPYRELLEKMFAQADPDWDKKPDIKWNFTKFIIDREGKVVARFEPTADMADVEECVRSLL